MNEMLEKGGSIIASALSRFLGWSYFTAWSISFYPQAILNHRRKSVEGLSFDFIYLNVYGFICLSVFNIAFVTSDSINEQYERRSGGKENLVRFNDVVFALHALLLSCLVLGQTLIYKKSPRQKVTSYARVFIGLSMVFVVIQSSLAWNDQSSVEWIDVLYLVSYIKLCVSFIKYVPQMRLNYRRKSTIGWSIYNILLDFAGGVLSLSQLLLDAAIAGDWNGVLGNPVKLGLGLLSISFDIIFMIQHYVLYTDREDEALYPAIEGERQPLLHPSE